MNYIDLFAGAGGLSEGFTSIGFNPVAHIEMNREACETLKTRAVYYYLKDNGKLNEYKKYLLGELSKEELYSTVPEAVLKSVIHQTMSEENMPAFRHVSSQIIMGGASHAPGVVKIYPKFSTL